MRTPSPRAKAVKNAKEKDEGTGLLCESALNVVMLAAAIRLQECMPQTISRKQDIL